MLNIWGKRDNLPHACCCCCYHIEAMAMGITCTPWTQDRLELLWSGWLTLREKKEKIYIVLQYASMNEVNRGTWDFKHYLRGMSHWGSLLITSSSSSINNSSTVVLRVRKARCWAVRSSVTPGGRISRVSRYQKLILQQHTPRWYVAQSQ